VTQQYPGAVRVRVDGHRSDDLLHDQYATAAVPTVPARFSSGSGCAAGRRDLQPSCCALQQRLPAQRRHPTLQVCRRQLSAAGIRPKLATVVASGYVSEAVFAQAHAEKLRLVAPVTKDTRAMRDGGDPAGGRPLGNVPETARRATLSAPPPRPRRLSPARAHRRAGVRATHDPPAHDPLQPPRHRRPHQRMAPRLRRAQPAQALRPPPPALSTINGPPRPSRRRRPTGANNLRLEQDSATGSISVRRRHATPACALSHRMSSS
jgi:hypothetical protein